MTKLVHFDFAIKSLLRNKANFDILEGFLSELLKKNVRIETLLESESNKNVLDDKSNRVDLLVVTEEKERVIIEVQASMEWDYLSRILYGASKVVTEYIKAGQTYRNICKIISVSIVFFNLGRGEDYVYRGTTEFRGIHQQDVLQLGENEQKAYGPDKIPSDLFPEYYIIKVNQFNERIRDKFDEWVYFLKTETIKPDFSAQGIKSAVKKLDILSLTDNDRKAYEYYEENILYEASMHESHYGRGKLDGREEGRQEEHEKAEREKLQLIERAEREKLQLIERAEREKLQLIERAEREKLQLIERAEQEKLVDKRQTVKKLLAKNMDINMIADSTGLSIEVVTAIKDELVL